jgi:hypothetical protein
MRKIETVETDNQMMTLDEGEAMVMMEGNETLERAEREESMELEEGGPESVKS